MKSEVLKIEVLFDVDANDRPELTQKLLMLSSPECPNRQELLAECLEMMTDEDEEAGRLTIGLLDD